eukprot:6055838-Pleurochrysis_carterae.AAC.2
MIRAKMTVKKGADALTVSVKDTATNLRLTCGEAQNIGGAPLVKAAEGEGEQQRLRLGDCATMAVKVETVRMGDLEASCEHRAAKRGA